MRLEDTQNGASRRAKIQISLTTVVRKLYENLVNVCACRKKKGKKFLPVERRLLARDSRVWDVIYRCLRKGNTGGGNEEGGKWRAGDLSWGAAREKECEGLYR